LDGPAVLRRDRVAVPNGRPTGSRDTSTRYVALPDFDPGIGTLAASIVAGAATDADRARAIESHLRKHGSYTDAPPAMGTGDDSPVEDFLLGELAGHCEYFASGMVVLARSVGTEPVDHRVGGHGHAHPRDLNAEPLAGLEAIGVEPEGEVQGAPAEAPKKRGRPKKADAAAKSAAEPAARKTRGGTKQAQVIDMLRRPEGATITQIAAATGWESHTV